MAVSLQKEEIPTQIHAQRKEHTQQREAAGGSCREEEAARSQRGPSRFIGTSLPTL